MHKSLRVNAAHLVMPPRCGYFAERIVDAGRLLSMTHLLGMVRISRLKSQTTPPSSPRPDWEDR